MAPAEKTESTVDLVGIDRSKPHHEGIVSASGRGFSSPLLGEEQERTAPTAGRARTGFASAGGWVVSL